MAPDSPRPPGPARVAPTDSPAVGATFGGRYVVERVLGQGGMAVVYLARDTKHDRSVALKVLRPELRESVAAQRFLQEVRVTSRLTHPHILPLLDSGEMDGVLYYVMPHVEGDSLRARLKRERQLPIAESVRIACEVAEGLEFAHRHGVVHRDIKPENILLEDGHAVIADFGIARAIMRAAGESLTATGISLGTPSYMSPEQASGESEIDGRTDIYALGCMLHEMIAGEPPFTGPTVQAIVARALSAAPARLRQLRQSVPETIERAVLRTLAKVPADRFQSAGAFLEALEADRSGSPGLTPSGETREVLRSRGRRRATIGIATALVLAGVAALLVTDSGKEALGRARLALGGRSPAPIKPNWVIVADFDGPANDPSLAQAARALITTVLDESRFVRSVAAADLRQGLHSAGKPDSTPITADVARELALRGSVKAVVTGRVDRIGKSHALIVQVIRPDSGTILVAESGSAPDADAFIPLIEKLGRRLREGLGEKREAVATETPALSWVTTPSLDAYRKFAEARRLIRIQRRDLAIPLFHQAVERDSGFASAWQGMAFQFWSLGMNDSAQFAFGQVKRHFDRLDEDAQLNTEAVEAMISGDFDRSLRAFDRMLARNPASIEALGNRSLVFHDLRRYEDAVASTRQAMALSPFGPSVPGITNIAQWLMQIGKWDEARSAGQLGHGPISEHRLLQVALGTENWSEIDSLGMLMMQPGRPTTYRRSALLALASAHAARGSLRAADSLLREARELPGLLESAASERRPLMAQLLLGFASGQRSIFPRASAKPDSATPPLVVEGVVAGLSGDARTAQLALDRISGIPQVDSSLPNGRQLARASMSAGSADWAEVVRILGRSVAASHHGQLRAGLSHWNFARWLVATAHERLAQPDSAVRYYEMIVDPIEAARNDELELRGFGLSFALQRLVVLYSQVGRTDDARRHWDAFNKTFTRPDRELVPLIAEARAALERAEALRR